MIGGGRDEGCFLLPSFFFFPLTYIAQILQKSLHSIYLDLSAVAKALWIMARVTLLTSWGIGRNLEKSRWVLLNPSTENKIFHELRRELVGVSQQHFIGKNTSQTCHGRPPSVYCYFNFRSRYETGCLAWSLLAASWYQAHQGDQLSHSLIDLFRIQLMKGTVRGYCSWELL